MADAETIRDGLATALAATGLRMITREGQQINPDCLVFDYPIPVDRETFDGSWRWEFTVTALVKSGSLREADATINDLTAPTGAKSVIALIDANPTLTDAVSSASVLGVNEVGIADLDSGGTAAFATWTVEILTDA